MQKARRSSYEVRQLVDIQFQVLFHSPPGVLFTFPSRYLFTIGGQEYLALEGGPPSFRQDFSCPAVLNKISGASHLSPTGLLPSMVVLSRFFWLELRFLTPCLIRGSDRYSLQPHTGIGPQSTKSVWFGLVPLSLAATKGISVDLFSSGY